jgi:NADPH:quinone reductase-like Zn-dependent oxidoreductase
VAAMQWRIDRRATVRGMTMKAVRFHDYGPPAVLTVEEVEAPEPEEGELLARVRAAGVNPVDWKLRQGMLKQYMPVPLPHILGLEFAGVVEQVGAGVDGYRRGDEVFGRGTATYAELAIAKADAVARKPQQLSFEQAAAIPIGGGAAWTALFDVAGVEAGQHVLVQGAAGGVGMFAVQLAHWKGAHVSGTASAKNRDYVQSLGADVVIDYTSTRFEDVVRDVDAVIDTVGGDIAERSLTVLKKGGILAEIAGQPPEELAERMGVRAALVMAEANTQRLEQLAQLVIDGVLSVDVEPLPLEQATRAHTLSESRHGRGRLVLRIAN